MKYVVETKKSVEQAEADLPFCGAVRAMRYRVPSVAEMRHASAFQDILARFEGIDAKTGTSKDEPIGFSCF
jgi:hypothetical protein